MLELAVFPSRLKAARLRAGLTQMQLGVLAQIDEYSASARINQYERGKHQPDFGTAERLALVLSVPLPYLYARNESLARLILCFGGLQADEQEHLVSIAMTMIQLDSEKNCGQKNPATKAG
jgi:transcriptional regulator with XRE-family HTH domain